MNYGLDYGFDFGLESRMYEIILHSRTSQDFPPSSLTASNFVPKGFIIQILVHIFSIDANQHLGLRQCIGR